MKAVIKSAIILGLAMGLAYCQPKAKTGDTEVSVVYPVRVIAIDSSSITRTLEYTANLAAYKEIHFAPATPGRIDNIKVEVGSRVGKGQVLVEMDKTQLATAKTQLESARDSYNRIKSLYDQGSIAEQQYEQTKTQFELAQQNVDYLMENTTLKSPINGIVTGKYFENGEMFSGAPNTQAGKAAIISLMQISPLKAIVNISQAHFNYVREGMKADITADLLKGEVFEGKVTRVYPTINTMTRTFQTEITVGNADEILRPGMFSRIKLFVDEDKAFLVPSIAVLKQPGTNNRHIFISQNGIARMIGVDIGKRVNDQVEIISGELAEGMELIVEGQARLIDGSEIEIKK